MYAMRSSSGFLSPIALTHEPAVSASALAWLITLCLQSAGQQFGNELLMAKHLLKKCSKQAIFSLNRERLWR